MNIRVDGGRPFPAQPLKLLRIMWFALFASTGLLMFPLYTVQRPMTPPTPFAIPFTCVALVILAVSILLPRARFIEMRKQGNWSAPRVIPNVILSLALTESISLLGFVLGFQNHPMTTYMPFFATSWLLFLLRFPRASHPLGFLGPAYGGE